MQVSKFTITSIAIGLVLSSVGLRSAKADSVTTTTTTIDSPAPNGVVYLRTASPSLLVTTIEGRRKDLEKQIDDAYGRGEISASQVEAMKRELRRIARETGSNTISYPAAVMLAQDLDLIGTQYRTVVTTAPVYLPIIAGSHFTISNGQVFELDDLSVRRANLEARVTKDLLQGRLSDAQAAQLRARLSNIGTEAAIYRADGNLDFKEARHLYTDFDRVATQIESFAGKDRN
jgi:hypothetical protein